MKTSWNIKPTFGRWFEGVGVPDSAGWSIGPENEEFGMWFFRTAEEAQGAADLYNRGDKVRLALELALTHTGPYRAGEHTKLHALLQEALEIHISPLPDQATTH